MWRKKISLSFLLPWEFQTPLSLGTPRLLINLPRKWLSHMVKNLPAMWGPGFNPWVGEIPWRRKWQPTPVFLPGESHGHRSLAGLQSMGSQRVGHDWTVSGMVRNVEEKKKICPFLFLENSRPLSPWGPPDFLSTCLGIDSLTSSPKR